MTTPTTAPDVTIDIDSEEITDSDREIAAAAGWSLDEDGEKFAEWDESAHPRAPAGSSDGGQFVSSGGGGGGEGSSVEQVERRLAAAEAGRVAAMNRALFYADSRAAVKEEEVTKDVDPDLVRLAKGMLQQEIDRGVVVIRRRHANSVDAILSEGDPRMKTQFETHTSGGYLGNDVRAGAEERMFDYNKSGTRPEDRPVYGYISRNMEHALGNLATHHYGGVLFVLKDEVKSRSTVTGEDSLPPYANPASRMSDVRLSSFQRGTAYTADERSKRIDTIMTYGLGSVNGYAEAQIHGQVHASDIAKIVLDKSMDATITKQSLARAKELGIKVQRASFERRGGKITYEDQT